AWDAELLDNFLAQLPHDTETALKLARARDERMHGREWLGPVAPQRLRHALEVRHPSFCQGDTVALLRRRRVALVVADTGGRWPEMGDVTADFLYLRLHGPRQLYASDYSDAQLAQWGRRIRAWAQGAMPEGVVTLSSDPAPRACGRNVFCFFDNTG